MFGWFRSNETDRSVRRLNIGRWAHRVVFDRATFRTQSIALDLQPRAANIFVGMKLRRRSAENHVAMSYNVNAVAYG